MSSENFRILLAAGAVLLMISLAGCDADPEVCSEDEIEGTDLLCVVETCCTSTQCKLIHRAIDESDTDHQFLCAATNCIPAAIKLEEHCNPSNSFTGDEGAVVDQILLITEDLLL